MIVAFSVGNVGAIGAAQQWQKQGGHVQGFVAVDAWLVPLWADFPVFTLCHDWSTDVVIQRLSRPLARFYAHPAVSHGTLWRAPQSVWGLGLINGTKQRLTAVDFVKSVMMAPGLDSRD